MGKDTLKNLLIAAGVFLVILSVIPKLLPQPRPPQVTPRLGQTSDVSTPDQTIGTSLAAGTNTPAAAQDAGGFVVREADKETTVTLGSAEGEGVDRKNPGPFRMRLTISSAGASIESATMTDHAQRLRDDARYELLRRVDHPDGTTIRSLAVEKINVDNIDIELRNKDWHVGSVSHYSRSTAEGTTEEGHEVSLWIEVLQHDAPALKLTRTYRLPKQPIDLGRHDLYVDLAVENVSDTPHHVIVSYLGGIGIPQGNVRMADQVLDIGTIDNHVVSVSRTNAGSVASKNGHGSDLYLATPNEPAKFIWLANANTYFTCTIAPQSVKGEDAPAYVAAAGAVDFDGNKNTLDDVTGRIVTTSRSIEPGATASYPAALFVGEKDAKSFKHIDEYVQRNYYHQISKGFGSCTFTWLVELMVWLLDALYFVVRDYGIAIVALVLIVRTMLHPITKKGQVNMVRMQQKMGEFTPKLQELKKKFGNDKTRLQQETMKLYREEGINPAGQLFTCLPMALQMPIWVALFLSLSNNIGMRHEGCIFLPWVADLTAQDALIRFATPLTIPLVGWKIHSFNLLPPLVSLFMYIQQKTQPKPEPNPNATPEQRQQQEMMQKMMPMMSIMMLLIFYNMPSGLNLYIMFSSLFGWLEQKRIRKHINEQKESGTLDKPKHDAARRKPGKLSFLHKLQAMAEDAQKQQVTRPPRKGKSKH